MRLELLERVPVTLTAHSTVVTAVIEAYVEERGRLLGARTQAFEGFLRLLVARETPLAVIERRATALRLRLDLCRSIVFFRPLASEDGHPAEADVEGLRGVVADKRFKEVNFPSATTPLPGASTTPAPFRRDGARATHASNCGLR